MPEKSLLPHLPRPRISSAEPVSPHHLVRLSPALAAQLQLRSHRLGQICLARREAIWDNRPRHLAALEDNKLKAAPCSVLKPVSQHNPGAYLDQHQLRQHSRVAYSEVLLHNQRSREVYLAI